MAKWEMTDSECAALEKIAYSLAALAHDKGYPLHVVREAWLKGFDTKAAELLGQIKGDEGVCVFYKPKGKLVKMPYLSRA